MRRWGGCSGSASSLARSWATKLSTVRAGLAWRRPHTSRSSSSRENTRCSLRQKKLSSSNSRWVSLTGLPRSGHGPRRQIDRDVAEAERGSGAACGWRRLGGRSGARPRAPQHGRDAREQLGQRERLGHVVVRAQAQRRHLVELVLSRRQHDHRHLVAGPAQRLEHPDAAPLGQRDVEQHEVRARALDERGGRLAVAGHLGAIALELEIEGQPFGDGRRRPRRCTTSWAAPASLTPLPERCGAARCGSARRGRPRM